MDNKHFELLEEAHDKVKRTAAKLFKENSVLREILAEEISRRIVAENELENYRKELKECKSVVYAISDELTKASRKEELVKIIRTIISKMTF